MSFERLFPCVEALITLGDGTISKITDSIKKEDDESRLAMLGYTMLRIMKRESALAHLEKLLAENDITPAVRNRLKVSQAEVAKWSDYPWDAHEIKK